MGRTGWIDSRAMDAHNNGYGHPERPERLKAIRSALARTRFADRIERREAKPATREELVRVHTPLYVDSLERICTEGGGRLDPDTTAVPSSWPAARLAAGAAIEAVDKVLSGEWRRAFCSVRPPGHHARPAFAMGFCLLNNAAVAAEAALASGRVQRVAILDWDVHHGNGTQESFWSRGDVMYVSWHQFPFYPGSGAADEIGEGDGLGTTVNCPLPEGAGDSELLAAWRDRVRPALEAFVPDLILISAGFDADGRDPLAGLRVTAHGYERLSAAVVAFAEEAGHGRVVSMLEGGYDLEALAEDVEVHLATML